MALEAQDNPFTYITLVDTADPSTPVAGTKRLWVDTDDALKIIDEAAVVTTVGGAAAGVATDAIFDAAGDLVQGTGANTAAKLTAGTAGQFLMSGGAAAANVWASRELDYVQITTSATATATTEATANALITGSAIAYNGSTVIMIEAWFSHVTPAGGAVHNANLVLYDGSSSIGLWNLASWNIATVVRSDPIYVSRRLTPSAATHTYSIRGYVDAGTATWVAGAGGSGASMPAYMRITRV